MKELILILEPAEYNPTALAVYQEVGKVLSCNGKPDLLPEKDQVTVIVCRLHYYLNEPFLKKFPNVRRIISPTTGLNHIDLHFCKQNNISIISLKGETGFLDSIRSTSEHTFCLILALVRNLVPSVKSVLFDHQWNRDLFKGRELNAMTLGVLGAGRIGRHIISYAKAFGMTILACDPHLEEKGFSDPEATFCSRKELFAKADIVTVHVDYSPDNEGMISRADFERMKPGSFLVNTARGELIVEEDIIWALENEILGGAALDVLSDEQEVIEGKGSNKIIEYAQNHSNLIITPHLGGCTIDAMHATELYLANKLAAALKQESVNPKT